MFLQSYPFYHSFLQIQWQYPLVYWQPPCFPFYQLFSPYYGPFPQQFKKRELIKAEKWIYAQSLLHKYQTLHTFYNYKYYVDISFFPDSKPILNITSFIPKKSELWNNIRFFVDRVYTEYDNNTKKLKVWFRVIVTGSFNPFKGELVNGEVIIKDILEPPEEYEGFKDILFEFDYILLPANYGHKSYVLNYKSEF